MKKVEDLDRFYGKKIRILRKKNKHTLKQMAHKLHKDFRSLSRAECGGMQITVGLLSEIATLYKVPITYFFTNNYENTDNPSEWLEFAEKMDELGVTPEQLERYVMSIVEIQGAVQKN